MATVKISNDFHRTSCTIRWAMGGGLSVGQIKKIHRELCGMPDCRCGQQQWCTDLASHEEENAFFEAVGDAECQAYAG